MTTSNFDRFYPHLGNVNAMSAERQLALVTDLLALRLRVLEDNREAESALCNLVGSLRRSSGSIAELPDGVNMATRLAVDLIRAVGRKTNFMEDDPSLWITQRDGSPRWANLKTFQVAPQRPALLGNSALNVRPDVVAFTKRFGKRWEKGTFPDTWFLLADGDQFTWRKGEIAHYMFETKEEFLERYGSGLDAFYFDRDSTRWKYCVLQLMDHLKTAHS